MITLTIPNWFLVGITAYFLTDVILNIWKRILDWQIKKATERLAKNEQIKKDLRDKIMGEEK